MLVVVEDHVEGGLGKKGKVLQDLQAHLGVGLHQPPFSRGEGGGLPQHLVGEGQLAQVVEVGPQAEALEVGEAQGPPQAQGELRHPLRVPLGLQVPVLQDLGQGPQGGLPGAAEGFQVKEALQSLLQSLGHQAQSVLVLLAVGDGLPKASQGQDPVAPPLGLEGNQEGGAEAAFSVRPQGPREAGVVLHVDRPLPESGVAQKPLPKADGVGLVEAGKIGGIAANVHRRPHYPLLKEVKGPPVVGDEAEEGL